MPFKELLEFDEEEPELDPAPSPPSNSTESALIAKIDQLASAFYQFKQDTEEVVDKLITRITQIQNREARPTGSFAVSSLSKGKKHPAPSTHSIRDSSEVTLSEPQTPTNSCSMIFVPSMPAEYMNHRLSSWSNLVIRNLCDMDFYNAVTDQGNKQLLAYFEYMKAITPFDSGLKQLGSSFGNVKQEYFNG